MSRAAVLAWPVTVLAWLAPRRFWHGLFRQGQTRFWDGCGMVCLCLGTLDLGIHERTHTRMPPPRKMRAFGPCQASASAGAVTSGFLA